MMASRIRDSLPIVFKSQKTVYANDDLDWDYQSQSKCLVLFKLAQKLVCQFTPAAVFCYYKAS